MTAVVKATLNIGATEDEAREARDKFFDAITAGTEPAEVAQAKYRVAADCIDLHGAPLDDERSSSLPKVATSSKATPQNKKTSSRSIPEEKEASSSDEEDLQEKAVERLICLVEQMRGKGQPTKDRLKELAARGVVAKIGQEIFKPRLIQWASELYEP